MDTANIRRTDQGLQVLHQRFLPDALLQLRANRRRHHFIGQRHAFDSLIDADHMPAVATFQRFAGQARCQGEQLTLQFRHRLALADLPQRTALSLRRAGRIFHRQLGETAGEFIQLLQQDFSLTLRKFPSFDIVRRALEQDVPHRQQRRAVEASAIVFVVTQTRLLVALRHFHLTFEQQARGRFFFVLTGADLQRHT